MPKPSIKQKVMPFGEHLEELRRRLIFALWGVVPILIVAMVLGKRVLGLLIEPIQGALQKANLGSGLQATGPLETFMTYFKVSITLTIIVASPWMLFQLWMFVAPGLYSNERRFAYVLAPLSFVLSASGVLFCFKVMLPITLLFLATFGADIARYEPKTAPLAPGLVLPTIPIVDVDPDDPPLGAMWFNREQHRLCYNAGVDADGKPMLYTMQMSTGGAISQQYRVSEYVSLLLGFCVAFAVSFQMPVAVLLLGWARLVEIPTLTRYRRHALFACAFLGAFLTPTTDPFTMFLLAGPLYALYELGIVLLRVLPASRVAGGLKSTPAGAGAGDA